MVNRGVEHASVECCFTDCYVINTVSNSAWHLDSRATTNMTNDIAKSVDCRVYNGLSKVIVGNGQSIPISHIGKTNLSSGSHSLLLKDLLYVPYIHKNILFVSKFANENNVYCEFYLTYCFIKDLATRQILF